MSEVTPYLQGKFLRLSEDTLTLPKGTIVYCFVDLGYEFRVATDRDFCGVREFIFDASRKYIFKPYH
jgi:hypothetical protein